MAVVKCVKTFVEMPSDNSKMYVQICSGEDAFILPIQ